MAGSADRLDRLMPGIALLRAYRRRWVRSDLTAGAVLAAVLVPQGMAYAQLAGLPPVTGLYTTVACLVAYAVFGPSRVLVLGPDSSVSPMIVAALAPLLAGGDPGRAVALAGMLAVIVAVVQIGMGLAHFGFFADLLSSEVQVGYLNGLALVIIASQLPKLFGYTTTAQGFGPELRSFVVHLPSTVGPSLVIGTGVLVLLLVLPRITRVLPAVLIGIVVATVTSALLDLGAHGVATVGTLPRGIPRPALPWTGVGDIGPLLVAALGITLVSLADMFATSSSLAARRGEKVDPNQEMVALGAANLAAGCLQGFAVSTSVSRTAVVEQAGAKSQVTSLVGAGVVVVLLMWFTSLLAALPESALAAVLIAAAFSLLDVSVLARYWRVRRSAFVLSLVATLAVVVLGVLQGILVAVGLAGALFFLRSWQPHGAVLGRLDAPPGWHNVRRYPQAREVPGIVVYRWEAPLFFANAPYFRARIQRLVRVRHPHWIIVECSAVTDIDVSAARMLEQLDRELNGAGVHLAFAELRARLQELVVGYGLFETEDWDRFYPTIESALAAIRGGVDPDSGAGG